VLVPGRALLNPAENKMPGVFELHRFNSFPLFLLRFLLSSAVLLGAQASSGTIDGSVDSTALWGTYRPHALMSVRARVPHSPYFGFMYHSAADTDIRHLASDQESSLHSYGFTRHDAHTFAEHIIEDEGLNAALTYSFAIHPNGSDNAWSLRVSGVPLDAEKQTKLVSIVFYAVAGPEELDTDATITEQDDGVEGPWGFVRFAKTTSIEASGVAGDCEVVGEAESIGGSYELVLREPHQGSVSSLSMQSQMSSSARRHRRRSDVSVLDSDRDLSRFHIAAPNVDPRKAFLVDETLKALLLRSLEERGYQKDLELSSFDDDSDEGGATDTLSQAKWPEPITLSNEMEVGAPLLLIQRIVQVPFEMDVAFSGRGSSLSGSRLEQLLGQPLGDNLAERQKAFDTQFENVFGLGASGFGAADVNFAKSAVANVLGGIGYFYGSTLVESETAGKRFRPPTGLLTATPSRALFPRGFLWDEGFHQLIVQRWNPALSRACLASWLAQVDDSGWIPREQALGIEARHRFPAHVKHLMVQTPSVANPPTILMPLRVFAVLKAANASARQRTAPEGTTCLQEKWAPSQCSITVSGASSDTDDAILAKDCGFVHAALDQAVKSFEWLLRSQTGTLPNTFRWRGRSTSFKTPDGYPLTLASGLDDYPRGYGVSIDERHLDLHCWVTWAAGALSKLCDVAGRDSLPFSTLQHTLLTALESSHGHIAETEESEDDLLLCDYDGRRRICEHGYVTILPLALGLLETSSPRVGAVLHLLESEDALRSLAGIRSLSKLSQHYRRGNDYWTGPIWMPFNFLILASLRTKYGREPGPYQERAEKLYLELKHDVLQNARREYESSGYLWENYSPSDGRGKSGRQFTGWSALVVLIYADMYDGVLTS
jgi:mannosyl-oligosaccharide glucosidase